MIKGIYESHLPVKDLQTSIKFYVKLGLKLAWKNEKTAFFWVEEGRSWLGLWEGQEYQTLYHPSLRHIAFEVSYQDLKNSLTWLKSIQIEAVREGGRDSVVPFIRPYQGNASVYFKDPDGNSLELMCFVEVPDHLKHISNKLTFGEWEELKNERIVK
ncbi:VOC family protein [Rummeliibacillus pycnus]|uniref:VOC family protein n=1 Tax=Rummeliibacillus pycnus TaxID=101070 RepID=UPI000C9B3876|nr:VOC family protein [Rummeliibacillus pycnus]